MALDEAGAANVLKIRYVQPKNLLKPFFEGSPFFAMLPKRRWSGKQHEYPVKYAHGNSGNINFNAGYTKARSNKAKYAKFQLTFDQYFTHYGVTGKVIHELGDDQGGFIRALQSEMDDQRDQLFEVRYGNLYSDGYGSLGEIKASGVDSANKKITLSRGGDIKKFQHGMKLQAVATLGSAARTGTMVITDIDQSAYTLSFSAGLITGLTAGDKLFQDGDYETNASFFPGVAAWNPDNTAFAAETTFKGVDRTVNRARLAGSDIGTKQSSDHYEDFLLDGTTIVSNAGGLIDRYVVSVETYNKINEELGAKVEYMKDPLKVSYDGTQKGVIGFDAITVRGARRPVKVFADPWCPDNKIYGFHSMNSYEFLYLGRKGESIVSPWNEDGKVIDRIEGQNEVGGSWKSYLSLMCREPVNTCVGTIAA